MKNIISLHEERLKKAIKEATASLVKARTLVAAGKEIPDELIPKLEKIIDTLEGQLQNYIENDSDDGE